MPIATTNPATGQVLKTFDPMSGEAIDARLDRAVSGFHALGRASFAERGQWLRAAAQILDRGQADADALSPTWMPGRCS